MSEDPVVEIAVLSENPTDAEVDDLFALAQVLHEEQHPGDPPLSRSELAGRLRHPPPEHVCRSWVAYADTQVVGCTRAVMDQRPANAGFVELDDLEVHPRARRRGVGMALARAAIGDLAAMGATSVMAWPWDEPGRRFAERLGLTFRQEERESRLIVSEVDESQQDEWIEAAEARAAGYRVVSFAERVADEHLDAWTVARDAMADAPLDDVEWTHQPTTAEWVRAVEAVNASRGVRMFCSLALDRGGAAAGMTAIFLHPDRPRFAHQEDTAVVSAHRGHGLGRWLKAANLRQVVAAHPEVEIVQTYNAESNGPMLDINVAMGFRPSRTYHAYQADLSDVLAALGPG